MTLDEDVAARIERLQRERGISFKEALNATLRAGLESGTGSSTYRLPTYRMGVRPAIDLDRALQIDAALEDEETLRKLDLRK